MKTLRDYQNWSVDGNEKFPGITAALQKSKSTLLVMATGLGKTVVISKVASDWTNGNVLCLAHRIELVDQMAQTLKGEIGYTPVIEQGTRGIDPDMLEASGNVIVGSIQSMITERRIRKFRKHPFGLIIIDEAHRATSPSYVTLVDRYRELDPECRVFGVTATPNRTDGTALGLVFESVAFEMGIVDGIDNGWLVDIHQKFAVVEELDLSKIPCKKNEFGEMDFKHAELEALLSQEGALHSMSRPVLDSTEDGKQAIIFAASVSHAHLWAAVLNHYRPGCAASVDGTMDNGEFGERRKIVKQYKSGQLQFLVNYGIFTEGFDAPNTSFVVMGRPTKSLLVYQQMLGRCTRVLPDIVDGLPTIEERKDAVTASAKPFATVLDFVGNSRHQVITATDVLGGNFDVDVRDQADELIGARETHNVRDALKKAKAAMLLAAEEERRKPIRNAIGDVKLKYQMRDVDPFGPTNGHIRVAVNRGTITDGQIAGLVNFGWSQDAAMKLSRNQAKGIMNDLARKRCTIKQGNTLRKFGYEPTEFNLDKAKAQIQAIIDNGWRRPQ